MIYRRGSAVIFSMLLWTLAYLNGVKYVAGCDASGGRNDSFTAISHRDRDGKIILDQLFERRSPFNPSDVVDEIVRLMKDYRCDAITGDHYGANWVTDSFIQSDLDRSSVYMDTLPIFTSGRARLRVISQFAALERRTFSMGRSRVDPGPGHDDLCNSAAISMSLGDKVPKVSIIAPAPPG